MCHSILSLPASSGVTFHWNDVYFTVNGVVPSCTLWLIRQQWSYANCTACCKKIDIFPCSTKTQHTHGSHVDAPDADYIA